MSGSSLKGKATKLLTLNQVLYLSRSELCFGKAYQQSFYLIALTFEVLKQRYPYIWSTTIYSMVIASHLFWCMSERIKEGKVKEMKGRGGEERLEPGFLSSGT